MATCPHCGTENKEKALFCANCGQSLPKKLKRLGGTQPLVEQVPAWLTGLLGKYREVPGPLIGLQEPAATPRPAEHPQETAETDANLSAVLDQMAEEGPPESTTDRFSSVEWGAYAEADEEESSAPGIDHILAGLELSPEDAYPPQPDQYDQPSVTETDVTDLGAPDWLTEELPPTLDQQSAESQPTGAPADVPDWLTEASAGFTSADDEAEPPAQEIGSRDVPDWLAETLDRPAPPVSEPPPAEEKPAAAADVPDWLADELETPAPAEPAGPSPETEPTSSMDVPDWLEPIPPDEVGRAVEDEREADAFVPDWIAEIAPPPAGSQEPASEAPPDPPADETSSADWAVPDWIAAARMTDDEESELESTQPLEKDESLDFLPEEEPPVEPPDTADIPDWLSDLGQTPLPSVPPAAEEDQPDVPDWLLEPDSTPPAEEADLPDLDAEDWLDTLDLDAPEETTEPAATPPALPGTDWLSEMDLPPVDEAAESVAETPPSPPDADWLGELDLDLLPGEETAEGEQAVPPADADWLVGIDTYEIPSEPVAEAETPPDATSAPAPSDEETPEDEPETPAKPLRKLKRLKPLKRLPPKPDQPAAPDWVAGLVPPDTRRQELSDPLPPDWATDLASTAAEAESGPVVTPTPDWAESLVPPGYKISRQAAAVESEPSPEPVLPADEEEMPDWPPASTQPEPTDFPVDAEPELADDQVDEAQEDSVDWISQFSTALPGTAELSEAMTELSDEEQPVSSDELLEQRLDWLAAEDEAEVEPAREEEPAAVDPGVAQAEEDLEFPEWLAETPGDEPEDEAEPPDWLTDALKAEAEVEPATPTAEEEIDIPDWLAKELEPEADDEEEPDLTGMAAAGATAVAGAAAFDWAAEEEPEAPAEEEPETPDWLARLAAPLADGAVPPEPALAEAEKPVEPPPDEEADETPDWLLELETAPTDAPTEDQPAEEAIIPDWLEEIPKAPGTGELSRPPEEAEEVDRADEEPAGPAAEVEESAGEGETTALPDWLADIPQAPTTGELSMPAEMEPEEVEELSAETESPSIPSPEEDVSLFETEPADFPDWLAEIPQAPATGELTLPPETEPEEIEAPFEQPEPPSFPSAKVAEEVGEVITGEAEETDDLPDWMSELGPMPAAGEETPDWLVTDEPEQADAEEDVDAEEQAAPDWLSELQAEEPEQKPAWLAEENGTDESDWLPTGEGEDDAQAFLSAFGEAVVGETHDWPVDETEAEAETDEVTPDWLVEEAETDAGEVAPDWLVDEGEAEAEADEVTPDWLVDEGEAEADDGEEIPDWLAELPPISAGEAEESSDSLADAGEGVTSEEAGIPDWLLEATETEAAKDEAEQDLSGLAVAGAAAAAGLTMPEAEESETTSAEESAEITEELPEAPVLPAAAEEPDWLSDLDEPDSPATESPDWWADAAEAPPVEAEDVAEGEEWLIDMRPGPGRMDEISAPSVEEEMEIPDWLSALRASDEEEEAPDWLAELTGVSSADIEPEADEPDWLAGLDSARPEPEEDDTPDWQIGAVETGVDEEEAAAPPEDGLETPDIGEAEASVPPAEDDGTEAEIPDWLADLPTPPAEAEDEEAFSDWLVDVEEPEEEDVDSPITSTAIEAEEDIPPWLAESALETDEAEEEAEDASGSMAAAALAGQENLQEPAEEAAVSETEGPEDSAEIAAEGELPEWLARLSAPLAEEESIPEAEVEEVPAVEEPTAPEKPADEALETPFWLAEYDQEEEFQEFPFALDEEPEAPAWLLDSEAEAPAALEERLATSVVEEGLEGELAEPEVEMPAPVAEPPESTEEEEAAIPAHPTEEAEPKVIPGKTPGETKKDRATGKPAEKKTSSAGLESSYSAEKADDLEVAEATGVLAGLSSLLPAQEVTAGASVAALGVGTVAGQQDAVLVAARQFQAIATHTPEPATLPAPLTRRDYLIRGGMRAGLYLIFILLIAIPLIPGLQRVTGTGQTVPWTEPAGALGDVLDKQRREMIGSEFGVVDLQQPGAVALVSFDYTPSTAGEMQPLAEAVVGRLKGQGMRLIFMSLEPEGATLAQGTLEQILEERGETYGATMVNLGYLPGQAVAIRELAGGRPFGTMKEYSGAFFDELQAAGWSGIDTIRQVDMVVTIADNPTTGRWWAEQLAAAAAPESGERYVLAATSALADPYLRPYRASGQFDGLISGINGAAAVEAGRNNFGPARQMLDSQSIAHLLIIILIAAGTMVGWMPSLENSG